MSYERGFLYNQLEKIVPHSVGAERSVIGSMLRLANPNVVQLIKDQTGLESASFFILLHAYIWEAINSISMKNVPPNQEFVAEELIRMGRLGEIGGSYLEFLKGKHKEVLTVIKKFTVQEKQPAEDDTVQLEREHATQTIWEIADEVGKIYLQELANDVENPEAYLHYAQIVQEYQWRRKLLTSADEIKGMALDLEKDPRRIWRRMIVEIFLNLEPPVLRRSRKTKPLP